MYLILYTYKYFILYKYYVLYKFCNGDVIKNQVDDDYYMKAYLANLTIRPSCCDCLFKGVNSMADITLADFWGVERVSPEMDDNKGISLAICHNNKGEDLLRDISNNATVVEFDYDEAVAGNPMIFKSPRSPGSRELFFEYMKKHDIQQSVELFCSDKPEIIKKVQDMEDYMDVKRKKGKLFAELWRIKNRL